MTPARIAELLRPFLVAANHTSNQCQSEPANDREQPAVLSPRQLQDISMYIDILLRWNARINLTAIRDPEEIVTRHFGESFFAARHLFPRGVNTEIAPSGTSPAGEADTASAPATLADIGSGAGFPGIPIKLWAPDVSLTLIDSNHKKGTFLREIGRALRLMDINVQTARAESLPKATFDVVTLRAVERFESILPVAAASAAPAGRLALLVGASQVSQVHARLPMFSWPPALSIPGSASRVLLVGKRSQERI